MQHLSRFDRVIVVLERSARALWIGFVVSGTAIGSAAVFILFNGPDPAEAEALAARLSQGPVAVGAVAPEGWTDVCLGEEGQDGRDLLASGTGGPSRACTGFNQSFLFYDHHAALAFTGPAGCHIIAVPDALFAPARPGMSRCIARTGLMMMEFDGPPDRPYLKVIRK